MKNEPKVETKARPIYEIAREIRKEWTKVNFAAEPYLVAMSRLSGAGDMYGADDAKSIVLYFLSNASGFRGDAAKRIKAELKSIFNIK